MTSQVNKNVNDNLTVMYMHTGYTHSCVHFMDALWRSVCARRHPYFSPPQLRTGAFCFSYAMVSPLQTPPASTTLSQINPMLLKYTLICIAHFYAKRLKCAQTWITQFYLQITPCMPVFTPQPHNITALWLVLILPESTWVVGYISKSQWRYHYATPPPCHAWTFICWF